MVKLYVADITNLPDPEKQPELLSQLPQERQQKIRKMRQEKSRKQSMGVGLLLQKVLALYHMEKATPSVGEHGKPQIEGLQFNLSHSGNIVICAVSDEPVGCDVEQLRKAPQAVAERFFTENEKAYLSQFSGEAYDIAFFRLWTMKESYVKMTGEGIGLTIGVYEIVVDEEEKVLRDGEIQECYLSEIEMDGYIISVCAKNSAHVEVIWENL